jgi:hypothetical protein
VEEEQEGQCVLQQDIRLACLSKADRLLAFSMSFVRDGMAAVLLPNHDITLVANHLLC